MEECKRPKILSLRLIRLGRKIQKQMANEEPKSIIQTSDANSSVAQRRKPQARGEKYTGFLRGIFLEKRRNAFGTALTAASRRRFVVYPEK